MRRVVALMVIGLVTMVLWASLVLAQSDEPEATVDTVTVQIDGVTRSLTVTYTLTGVLAVEVGPAPITETFAVTAQGWLDDLFASLGTVKPDGKSDIEEINAKLDEFLEATETVPYPARYTPFVRQYRFTIHTCRDWIAFQETLQKDSEGAIFAVAPYVTMQSACKNRYQEAYVEMERIVYAELSQQ